MATVQPNLIQFNAFPYIAVGTIAIDCSLSESGSQVKIKSSSKQDIYPYPYLLYPQFSRVAAY